MCRAEFAPQFRFCPVDGLPLTNGDPDALAALAQARQLESLASEHTRATSVCVDETLRAEVDADELSALPDFVAASTHARGGAHARAEYQLTILAEAGLWTRLTIEVRAVAAESQLTWPEFKRAPAAFARRTCAAYGRAVRRRLAEENVGYGLATALALMLMLGSAVVAVEQYHRIHQQRFVSKTDESLELIDMLPIPTEPKEEAGAPGMAAGDKGGGMKQNRERPGGGGGGGDHQLLQASNGKLPQAMLAPPIVAPNPQPPSIQNPQLPTPSSIQVDPVLFPPDSRALPYGDPKSQQKDLSAGTGDGGGIGSGSGGGVGSGNGTGYGNGTGWNTGGGDPKLGGDGGAGCGAAVGCGGNTNYANRIFNGKDVSRRAIITFNPEPLFTEEARRNNTTGEVILKVVLTAAGQVTNIVPVKRLPDGLTEKAIEAASRIKFTPAEKDGHKVSQYSTIVYNFNIY
jgi:TonB family protein